MAVAAALCAIFEGPAFRAQFPELPPRAGLPGMALSARLYMPDPVFSGLSMLALLACLAWAGSCSSDATEVRLFGHSAGSYTAAAILHKLRPAWGSPARK